MSNNDELIDTVKAAEILGVTVRMVQYWIEWKKLTARRIGRYWVLKLEDVEKFRDKREEKEHAHNNNT